MTRWSLLALLSVLLGGGLTLAADRLQLRNWAHSGIRVPVGEPYEVKLPAGDQLVYYETTDDLPTNVILIAMQGENRAVFPRRATRANDFKMPRDGWSGRSIWEIDDLAAGWYTMQVKNGHYESASEVPDDDRIVFAKEPATLAAAQRRSWIIRIGGAALTMVLVVVFYTLHGRAS